MKIAFVVKPFVVEMLGIAYLAAALKKEGHQAILLRTDDIYPRIRSGVDVLAYSLTTGQQQYYLKLNREIKRQNMITVLGGPHPTYFPEVAEELGVDYIIRGEGEQSFPALLKDLRLHMKVSNVFEPHKLIQDLDTIPFPDREFLYTYSENRNNPIKNVMTSRGCPYSCPYCFNSLYKKMYEGQRFVRYRSPENVVQECFELKRYPLKLIYFQDDELLMNPKFFELMDMYATDVQVPFHAQLRIEWLTEKKMQALVKAGCSGITFAIESGDMYIRKEVLKRNVKDEQIIKGVELLRKYKMKFRIENMVGIPGEHVDAMMKTYELNRKLKPTIGWCSIFQPYPNLPLANFAKENGWWDGNIDMKESFFEETVLNFPWKEEIENLQKLFGLGVAYQIPTWIMRWLIKLPFKHWYAKGSHWCKEAKYKLLYGTEE